MRYTVRYGLRRPEPHEYYNVEDFNYNADVIDEAMSVIDGGTFEEAAVMNQSGSVSAHNADAEAHVNIVLDSGEF